MSRKNVKEYKRAFIRVMSALDAVLPYRTPSIVYNTLAQFSSEELTRAHHYWLANR